MPKKRQKAKKLQRRLFTRNRLVILNEDSFEEIFSLRLTLMNVFVVASLGAVIIIFLTTLIIAFTPLREYIPGYASDALRQDARELHLKTDSLSVEVQRQRAYISALRKALTGQVDFARLNKDSIQADTTRLDPENFKPGAAEEKLRGQIPAETKNKK